MKPTKVLEAPAPHHDARRLADPVVAQAVCQHLLEQPVSVVQRVQRAESCVYLAEPFEPRRSAGSVRIDQHSTAGEGHAGRWMAEQGLDQPRNAVRHERVVMVQKLHKSAVGVANAPAGGAGLSRSRRVQQQANPVAVPSVQDLRSAIRRAVVDHDDLDIRIVLIERGIDCFAHEIALVEDREANRDQGLWQAGSHRGATARGTAPELPQLVAVPRRASQARP